MVSIDKPPLSSCGTWSAQVKESPPFSERAINRHVSPRSPLAVNVIGVKPIPEVTKRPTTSKARNVSNSNAPVQVQN